MDPVTVLSGDAPVLAVRLTQLAGGGSILAVTASHVVLGADTLVAWSLLLHGHSCVLCTPYCIAVALAESACYEWLLMTAVCVRMRGLAC
jgi:hypothetical protein